MAELPDDDLADTRHSLAPTLDAARAILPWIGKTPPQRFPAELNQRWQACCKALASHWSERGRSTPAIRPDIFQLLQLAVESGDVDYLYLAETLASVADHLEYTPPSARLSAALSATCEALCDGNGLENPQLPSRAQHFAARLADCLRPSHKPGERSNIVDRLFVDDALERIEEMREALAVLPIDVHALAQLSRELTEHSEQIEMWGIYHQGRELHNFVLQLRDASTASQDQARDTIDRQLDLIESTLLAVDG